MTKGKRAGFLAVVVLSMLFGFVPAGGAVELKLGHNSSPLSPMQKAAVRFADLVKEKTGGKVTVAVFPAAQLGKPPELLQAVAMGSVDIFLEAAGWYSNVEKDFNLYNLPFVVKDSAHLMRIMDSPVGQEMFEKMRARVGIVTLTYVGLRTPRDLLSTRPIRTVDDLKGLKLRVPEVKSYIEAWKALGASPTPISWSEVYMALGQGIVDGVEGSLPDLYHSKFYEFAKYCTMIEYKPTNIVFAMSQKRLDSFPPDVQRSLKEAANEAAELLTKLERQDVSEVRQQMQVAGVTFITVDTAPFVKKVIDLPERLEREGFWSKGLYARWKAVQ